jgi:subtilisin family serine protease
MYRKFLFIFLAVMLMSISANSADNWPYLPNGDIGGVDFRNAYPEYDGRGVVVAILDTGIDAFAPGMGLTSLGGTKMIECRDFTPEGEWTLTEATVEDGVIIHEDGLRLEGAADLKIAPDFDGKIWFGIVSENDFHNNDDVNDFNDDGDTTDKFGLIVYKANRAEVEDVLDVGCGLDMLAGLNETAAATVAEERSSKEVWLVVVDADADGHLDDETPMRDYHVNYDLFTPRNDDNPDTRSMMAWAVNVDANEDYLGKPLAPTLEFHFDSGSHGSHCAGIAAGNDVMGQKDMDGTAPGAWLISMKLGDNNMSGGATRTSSMKDAYDYAVEFGEKYGLPVVVNMSFGIASVEEAEDDMGEYLDKLMSENPGFYICTSAGNEGPGLSTIGIPGTSSSVITVGAYISKETGRDLYDANLPMNTLYAFSSRGGETPNPDVVAPGGALSTVPGFVDGPARYNGTSMASPQVAGAVACLVSAALAEGKEIHWGMIKRALIAGATPVKGLQLFEQGGGLVNISNSWNVLKKLSDSKTAHQVLDFQVETACPIQIDGMAPAAYWRTPGGLPTEDERVRFTVTPIFHPDMTPDEIDNFFRSFTFKSEAPWLKVITGKDYIRGDSSMTVDLKYKGKNLSEPGVYSARVIGSLDSGDLSGLAGRELYLWNTIVIGHKTGQDNGYSHTFTGSDLGASTVHRYHVDVPASATAMRVRLEVSKNTGSKKGAGAYVEINNPEGFVRGGFNGYARPDGPSVTDAVVTPDELYAGTWGFNVVAGITNLSDTGYKLTVSFDGYDAPEEIVIAPVSDTADSHDANFTVIREFPGVFKGSAKAAVLGFRKEQEVTVEESDTWSHTFTLDGTTPSASFDFKMSQETANLFTDCCLNILDSSGVQVRKGSFDGETGHTGISLPSGSESATYTVKVVGGFALAEKQAEWGFDVVEMYNFASPVTGSVKRAGGGSLKLYCGVPCDIDVSFDGTWAETPEGMHPYGAVRFMDSNLDDEMPADKGGRLVMEIPVFVK